MIRVGFLGLVVAAMAVSACRSGNNPPDQTKRSEFGCLAGTVTGSVVGGSIGRGFGRGTGRVITTGIGSGVGRFSGSRLACG